MAVISIVVGEEPHNLRLAAVGSPVLAGLVVAFHNHPAADRNLRAAAVVDHTHLVGRIRLVLKEVAHIPPAADHTPLAVDHILPGPDRRHPVEEHRIVLVEERRSFLAVGSADSFRPFHHMKDQCYQAGA